MHGTWYKGPQLAHTDYHHHHHHHQFRSYPSFVVTPYQEQATNQLNFAPIDTPAAGITSATTPIVVEGTFTATGLTPTIKIEQNYADNNLPVDEPYALNLDCAIDSEYRVS